MRISIKYASSDGDHHIDMSDEEIEGMGFREHAHGGAIIEQKQGDPKTTKGLVITGDTWSLLKLASKILRAAVRCG